MRRVNKLRDIRQCKRGNALIIVAATTPLLIGASAIGLDTIQVTLAKRQLQRAADSAAMAGAMARVQNETKAAAEAAVDRDLTHNNNLVLSSPRVVENAPATGTFATDQRAVRVVLRARRDVPFMSFFTGEDVDIEVEATATAMPDGTDCVRTLERGNTPGITFAGTAAVNLGCGIFTNSTATNAIAFNGGPIVTASPVAARGGVPAASNFQGSTVVLPYSPSRPDPYAHLADPVLPATCANKTSLGASGSDPAATLAVQTVPGVYCFRGLKLDGRATLPSNSVIYIDGGELDFGSQANVQGTGITFILTSSNIVSNPGSVAGLKMNAQASVRLTAPTTGTYANLLIYQDRRASTSEAASDTETDETKIGKNHINGGSNSLLNGVIYMPKAQITFNGGAGLDVQCIRLVTQRVKFSGNVNLTNNCSATSPHRGWLGLTVRLVS